MTYVRPHTSQVTPVYSAAALSHGAAGTGSGGAVDGGGGGREDFSTLALAQPIVENVASRLPRLHSLLLGPGMGRHPAVRKAAAGMVRAAREKGVPVVLDADAIAMVVADPEAVRGFAAAVLTPNANEFRLLCERMERSAGNPRGGRRPRQEASPPPLGGRGAAAAGAGQGGGGGSGDGAAAAAATVPAPDQGKALLVERLARYLGGATVVLKGKVDIISDGARTVACAVPGGLKRCGGIGDVLSGTMATALAWVNLQQLDGEEVGSFCGDRPWQ